jgi:uncharacterized protein YqkB
VLAQSIFEQCQMVVKTTTSSCPSSGLDTLRIAAITIGT